MSRVTAMRMSVCLSVYVFVCVFVCCEKPLKKISKRYSMSYPKQQQNFTLAASARSKDNNSDEAVKDNRFLEADTLPQASTCTTWLKLRKCLFRYYQFYITKILDV